MRYQAAPLPGIRAIICTRKGHCNTILRFISAPAHIIIAKMSSNTRIRENGSAETMGHMAAEAESLPLLMPVLMGLGICIYFALPSEPGLAFANILLASSVLLLLFAHAGNSSARVSRYKRIFALSTLKYALKKLFKLAMFALLFPVLGQFALFLLAFDFVMKIFAHWKFLRLVAFLWDNALISAIWRRLRRTFVGKYSRDVVKTSHSRHGAARKIFELVLARTRAAYGKMNGIVFGNAFMKRLAALGKRFAPALARSASAVNAAAFFVILGLFLSAHRTAGRDTRLLQSKIARAEIEGRVVAIEPVADDFRITLGDVAIANAPDIGLDDVRIKFKNAFGAPAVGSRVSLAATLSPPFEPSVHGGFNYALYSYFKKLSASGRAFSPWKYADIQPAASFASRMRFGLSNLRARMNERVLAAAPGPAGGVLVSITTGDIYALNRRTAEDYRRAGIAHMISISGLHMTLVVGFAFFLVRILFALSVPLASRIDAKKAAALFAFAVSLAYLMISGARIATQRAFIMTGLGLLAILLDRSPFSMRFVAASAIVILGLGPESILNPGFQMSFVAVAALIRIYEARERWMVRPDSETLPARIRAGISNALRANLITNIALTAAIAPFVIKSFNTIQVYGALGNLVAIPVFSLLVMPFILLAFLAMPLGLEGAFLKVAALGAELIGLWAGTVADLPGASLDMKSMGAPAFALISAGLVWILLWRRRWKYFGIVPVAAGVIAYALARPPDVYADPYGTMFGVRRGETLHIVNLSKYRPDPRIIADWRVDGAFSGIAMSGETDFVVDGAKISFVDRYSGYKSACRASSVVFATFDAAKAYSKCNKPVFDRKFFRAAKGAAFHVGGASVGFRTVRDGVGSRPWSLPGPAASPRPSPSTKPSSTP